MVIPVLHLCRWKFSHKETLCQIIDGNRILLKKKNKNRFLSKGNVRTPSIARWKARGRLPIRHN